MSVTSHTMVGKKKKKKRNRNQEAFRETQRQKIFIILRKTYSEEAAALTVVLRRATTGLAVALARMGVPTRKAAIGVVAKKKQKCVFVVCA